MRMGMMKMVGALAIALMLAGCMVDGASSSARQAEDRIMLVRENPITLGQRRLIYETAAHPELGEFLRIQGRPDFIAETSSDERRYMIMYYLDSGRAFACRFYTGMQRETEFAGPYPITEKERSLLSDLKRQATPDSAALGPEGPRPPR